MFEHLLIATDFSTPALLATSAGASLARAFGAKVTLAHVCPSAEARERREGLETLREERFSHVDEVEVAVLRGDRPAEALAEHATDVGADLVVAGRHGEHDVAERLLGSNTERLVRRAPASVLVVHPATREPLVLLKHIVVGTDLSEASMPAVDAAAVLARSFDAWTTLIHVYDLLPATVELLEEPYISGEGHSLAAIMQRKLEVIRKERLDRVPAETLLLRDKSPVAAICDYASDRDVGLVVVGTHGRTGLSRFVLGSVAERVIRHAPTSVLVVRR